MVDPYHSREGVLSVGEKMMELLPDAEARSEAELYGSKPAPTDDVER